MLTFFSRFFSPTPSLDHYWRVGCFKSSRCRRPWFSPPRSSPPLLLCCIVHLLRARSEWPSLVFTRSVIVFWGELIGLLLSSSLNGINANKILWEKCKKRALKCLSTEPPSQTQVCLCGITILDDVWRSSRSHRFYPFNDGLQRTVFWSSKCCRFGQDTDKCAT